MQHVWFGLSSYYAIWDKIRIQSNIHLKITQIVHLIFLFLK